MAPRLNVIEIFTADMAASLAFYRRLGLEIPEAADTELNVELKLDGFTLVWDSIDLIKQINPGYVPGSGGPRVGLAFQCDSPDEVDRVYADLVDAGAHGEMAPFDASWGPRYAVLHDPDGNAVDLYAPRS